MTNVEKFEAQCQRLQAIYEKKNEDYGNSFDKTVETFGITPAIARMCEKLDRIISLLDKGDANYESITDSLDDLANYAIMTRMAVDDLCEPCCDCQDNEQQENAQQIDINDILSDIVVDILEDIAKNEKTERK